MKMGAKRALLWASTVLSLAVPAVAEAQTAANSDEVIVTARRREESQQDVPLAVSALNTDQLARANVTDINSLQGTVPNLVISPGQGSGGSTPVFAIRGLSQQDLTHLSDPSVSLYINDVVIPRPIGGNIGFFDVASVQVLRGPQGTLFGRNTPGGAVVVTTQMPTQRFEGYVSETVANFGSTNTEAAINIPMGDALSVRVAGMKRDSDGYITDVVNGNKINTIDEGALRVTADFHPTNTFSSVLIVDSATSDNGGTGSIALPGSSGGAAQALRDHYHTASGIPQHSDVDIFSITDRTTLNLSDHLTLRNIAAYRELQNNTLEDTDGSGNFILPIQRITSQNQFSEELQLLGEQSWGDWIAGAYYFKESGDDQGLSAGAFAGCGGSENLTYQNLNQYSCYSNTWSTARNTSYAVFAQADFKLDSLIQGLSATVGVRQNWDQREAVIKNRTATACRFTLDTDNNPATPEVNPGLAGCALPLSKDFDEPTYNISLQYQANDDVLFYLAHRHGYRTGGFGARASTQVGLSRNFLPETVNDIELGMKADWHPANTFLRTNLAVFYEDYTDIQRLLTDPTTLPVTTVTANAGGAKIKGAELEWLFRPTSWFEFSGFWAYTDASFTDFQNPFNPADHSLSNAPFARAPKNIESASARVDLPVPASVGDANIGVSYFHQDRYSANDTFNAAYSWQEAYDLVNVNGEWNHVFGSNVDLLFFVNNAFDNTYTTALLQITPTVNSAIPSEPRTYGVRLRYNFGQ
ncbi:MAG TPA: TonB-dependent receptor [Caulobacterales bacterium]|nr:TonB-dependent receptor [Caulobacterales bacterium]